MTGLKYLILALASFQTHACNMHFFCGAIMRNKQTSPMMYCLLDWFDSLSKNRATIVDWIFEGKFNRAMFQHKKEKISKTVVLLSNRILYHYVEQSQQRSRIIKHLNFLELSYISTCFGGWIFNILISIMIFRYAKSSFGTDITWGIYFRNIFDIVFTFHLCLYIGVQASLFQMNSFFVNLKIATFSLKSFRDTFKVKKHSQTLTMRDFYTGQKLFVSTLKELIHFDKRYRGCSS